MSLPTARRFFHPTVLVLIPTLCLAQPPQVEDRPAEFGVAVGKDVMIRARDGTRLAADVYRPARDGMPNAGRFPTPHTRKPYYKNGAAGEGQHYAGRGFNVVANDVRWRY